MGGANRNTSRKTSLAAAGLAAVFAVEPAFAAVERWHPAEFTFQDHESYSETGNPNPFLDRRLVATFTAPSSGCVVAADCAMNAHTCDAGSCVYKVEGYFDSDGRGGTRGSDFSVVFAPHRVGRWRGNVRFCEGDEAAASVTGSTCGRFDDGTAGLSGCESGSCPWTFDVVESTANAPDFRAPSRGLIVNDHRANGGAGERYLRFLGGNPGYFVEVGMNAGEGMLGYSGFDNTKTLCSPDRACVRVKTFASHVQHWRAGDPDWSCGVTSSSPGQSQNGCTSTTAATAGRGVIGAINYLSDPANGGVNSKYIILNSSPNGDTCDVYPFVNGASNAEDRSRYDISKLRQWRMLFEHMMTRGVLANLVFGEDENECTFQDAACTCSGPRGACIGSLRRVYLREMVARFGHLPALRWSVDEENDFTNPARRDIVEHLKALDPYDHPVSIHTEGSASGSDEVYVDDMSGVGLHHGESDREPWDGDLDAAGLQATFRPYTYDIFAELWGGSSLSRGTRVGYSAQSTNDEMRWPVIVDEPQGCDHQMVGEGGNRSMPQCRRGRFFPGLFSGLAGWEWYFEQTTDGDGDNHDHDPCVESFAVSEGVVDALRWSGVARDAFGRIRDVAALEWSDDEAYVSDGNAGKVWQGARANDEYVAYQDDNDGLRVSLSGTPNDARFEVTFIDPDLGDACECIGPDCASDGTVAGGGMRNIGACPCCNDDSLVVIQATDASTPETTTTLSEVSTTTITTTTLDATTTTLPAASGVVVVDDGSVRWACGGNASDRLTIQNVTVGEQPDRILLVGVGAEENNADCNLAATGASVTYRGTALQRAVSAVSGTSSWRSCNGIFFMLAPPAGTGNVVVTFPSAAGGLVDNRHAGAVLIHGAAQRAPDVTRSQGSSWAKNPATLSVPVPTAGSLVLDIVSQGNTGEFTPLGDAQIEHWDVACKSSGSAVSTHEVPQAESVTTSWDHSDPRRFALSAASFAPADAGEAMSVTLPSTSTTTVTLPVADAVVQVDASSARSACGGGASNRLVVPGVSVGTQPDRILVVAAGAEDDDSDCDLGGASATYGDLPLVRAVTAVSDSSSWRACNAIFYLLDPPSGTDNVTVTFPSATPDAIDNRHGGAIVLYDAAQDAPDVTLGVGSSEAADPVTTVIADAIPGSVGIDVITQGADGEFRALAAAQVELWEASCTCSGSAMSTQSVRSDSDTVFSWSHSDSSRFALAIATFRPAE